jgi:hypothetical protein
MTDWPGRFSSAKNAAYENLKTTLQEEGSLFE